MPTILAEMRQFTSKIEPLKVAIAPVLSIAIGFILSGASIMSVASPFAVAWAGAVAPELALYAALGAILGYFVLVENSLRYLATMVILLGLRWALSFLKREKMILYSPVMAAVAVVITGFAVTIPGSIADYILVLAEGTLVVSSGMIFSRGVESAKSQTPFAGTNGLCLGLILTVLYMGLSAFSIFGVSPARVGAVWLIILAASFSGAGASSVVANACGISAALSGSPEIFASTVCCGLLTGIFAPLGRIVVTIAAVVASVLTLLVIDAVDLIPVHLVELAIVALAVAFTPSAVIRVLGLAPACDLKQGELFRRSVFSRLNTTKSALSDIAEVTSEVSLQMEKMQCDPIEKFIAQSVDTACRGCADTPRCWQSGFSFSNAVVISLFADAKAGIKLTEENIPTELLCRRRQKLANTINTQAGKYLKMRQSKKSATQLKTIVSDQFEGMALLLASIEQEVRSLTPMLANQSSAVAKYLKCMGISQDGICCSIDKHGRAIIFCTTSLAKSHKMDLSVVTVELSDLCGQELALPQVINSRDYTQMTWTAKGNYMVNCEWIQRAAGSGKLCGDSIEFIDESQGRSIMLLSDGMGVGSAAAVDSTMTTALLSRLLRAGCSFEAALRLVNSALLSYGDERLCTIDSAIIDLHTARVDFYKAGAAPSFVLRGGKVITVESDALPAGILGGATAKKTRLVLSHGDIIIMVSDGITDGGTGWIASQLLALSKYSLDVLCDELLKTARARSIDDKFDDMSVMAAIITK